MRRLLTSSQIAVSKALSGGDPKAALDEAAANLKVLYKQQ